MSRVERMFGPRESWGKGNEMAQVRERAAGPQSKGVMGFVAIKCTQCGKVHNTCLHEERTIFICKKCGQPVALEGLKSIKMECPRCRFKARYLTNRQEKLIQMECLNCSHPVNFRKGFRRGNYVVEVEA